MTALHSVLETALGVGNAPSLHDLTVQALFSDVLAGVLAPEFVGNLQFSAYTLKTIAASYGVELDGYRLSWDELVSVVDQGKEVLANIEERHYVVITGISGTDCTVIASGGSSGEAISDCTVTFRENGYTRTKSGAEFYAKWFGIALVDGSVEIYKRSTTVSDFVQILTEVTDFVALYNGDFVVVTGASGGNVTYTDAGGTSQSVSEATFGAGFNGETFFSESVILSAVEGSTPLAGILGLAPAAVVSEVEDSLHSEALTASVRFVRVNDLVLSLAQENVLKTEDLLKVKGAGFFSKFFKKIFKFFKKVLKKLAKILKKFVAIVNKALTAAFGKVIGGALASLITAPYSFMANSLDFIAEGDFKGLFKYVGKMLIQIAIQVVVAIVAPYLLGALQAVLGAFLNFIGGALQGIGGFLTNAFQGASNFLGNAVNAIGEGLVKIGDALQSIGDKLIEAGRKSISKAQDAFKSFKEDKIGTVLGKIKEKLNPLAKIGEAVNAFIQDPIGAIQAGLDLAVKKVTSFASAAVTNAVDYAVKVGEIFAKHKIDKELAKKKMSSFLRTLVSEFTNAGISEIGDSVGQGIKTAITSQVGVSTGAAQESPELNTTQRSDKREEGEQNDILFSGAEDLPDGSRIVIDPDGEVRIIDADRTEQTLVGNLTDSDLEALLNGGLDNPSLTGLGGDVAEAALAGLLDVPSSSGFESFNDARFSFADNAIGAINGAFDQFRIATGGNQSGLTVFGTITDSVQGALTASFDTLKLGSGFGRIRDSFVTGLRDGEFLNLGDTYLKKGALGLFTDRDQFSNLLDAGQGALIEGGRMAIFAGGLFGSVRSAGSGGIKASLSALRNDVGFARISTVNGSKSLSIGKNQTFSRFVSQGELDAINRTGLLRGGKSGETFFTTNKFQTIESATQKLALPKAPEYRIDFRIVNRPVVTGPRRVQPGFGQPGGGYELLSDDFVEILPIRVRRLRRRAS